MKTSHNTIHCNRCGAVNPCLPWRCSYDGASGAAERATYLSKSKWISKAASKFAGCFVAGHDPLQCPGGHESVDPRSLEPYEHITFIPYVVIRQRLESGGG